MLLTIPNGPIHSSSPLSKYLYTISYDLCNNVFVVCTTNNLFINKYFFDTVTHMLRSQGDTPTATWYSGSRIHSSIVIEQMQKYTVHVIVMYRIYMLNSVCSNVFAFNVHIVSGITNSTNTSEPFKKQVTLCISLMNASVLSEFCQNVVPMPTIMSDVT
jgi:hypothetical protein